MSEHLPECPKSGCPACYEQGKHDCALTHAIRGLKDMNRIAARGYDDGHHDALAAAVQRVEAMWLLDPSWDGTNWNIALTSALAAIDALTKGEQP